MECSICKEDFIPNSSFFATTCGHIYHKLCINEWIKRQNNCPQCRTNLDKPPIQLYLKLDDKDPANLLHEVHQVKEEISKLEEKLKEQTSIAESLQKQRDVALASTTSIEKLNDIKREVNKLLDYKERYKKIKQSVIAAQTHKAMVEIGDAIFNGDPRPIQDIFSSIPYTSIVMPKLDMLTKIVKMLIETKEEQSTEMQRENERVLKEIQKVNAAILEAERPNKDERAIRKVKEIMEKRRLGADESNLQRSIPGPPSDGRGNKNRSIIFSPNITLFQRKARDFDFLAGKLEEENMAVNPTLKMNDVSMKNFAKRVGDLRSFLPSPPKPRTFPAVSSRTPRLLGSIDPCRPSSSRLTPGPNKLDIIDLDSPIIRSSGNTVRINKSSLYLKKSTFSSFTSTPAPSKATDIIDLTSPVITTNNGRGSDAPKFKRPELTVTANSSEDSFIDLTSPVAAPNFSFRRSSFPRTLSKVRETLPSSQATKENNSIQSCDTNKENRSKADSPEKASAYPPLQNLLAPLPSISATGPQLGKDYFFDGMGGVKKARLCYPMSQEEREERAARNAFRPKSQSTKKIRKL